jgi:hypothetical protein
MIKKNKNIKKTKMSNKIFRGTKKDFLIMMKKINNHNLKIRSKTIKNINQIID